LRHLGTNSIPVVKKLRMLDHGSVYISDADTLLNMSLLFILFITLSGHKEFIIESLKDYTTVFL
jgi:hypothetical protein